MTYSKKLTLGLLTLASTILLTACSEAERVSSNLGVEADNFNPNMWVPAELKTID
ncbi:hypothetical protein BOVMAS07_02840 [Streptococcus uberis]|uniref:beta-sandwich lipoprotein n=1 Tax=Streptococcus agalactiae TaxID=1311 RepID=UPI000301250A|nr:hypothetical protein [Streptococcus agalactiae]HEO7896923.1 hypothetical protein [Streptococcus agalactiae]